MRGQVVGRKVVTSSLDQVLSSGAPSGAAFLFDQLLASLSKTGIMYRAWGEVTEMSLRIIARSLRIWTGLILLLFVSCHLLNASFGIISLQAMDTARPYLTGFWSAPPLGGILALSLVMHFLLGLLSVYQRPTLRTNTQDIVQVVTALLVVPIMATHVIGIMMTDNAGLHLHYAETIRLMWITNPTLGLLQILVVTVVWLHGCAGLLIWLRSKESARNIIFWVYPIVIAIPVLSLLGFSEAGRHVLEVEAAPATVVAIEEDDYGSANYGYGDEPEAPPQVDFERISTVTFYVIWTSLGMAALTLLARAIRLWLSRGGVFEIVRDGHEIGSVPAGLSLFDAFQQKNEPHAGLCQGRGRCGTCAVRVLSSEFPLPEPTEIERQTLVRRELPDTARLACQLMPSGGCVTVEAMFPPDYSYHSLDDVDGPEGSSEAPA